MFVAPKSCHWSDSTSEPASVRRCCQLDPRTSLPLVQRRILLDVVVGQCAPVLKLLDRLLLRRPQLGSPRRVGSSSPACP
eukprot:COSAG02_NODE_43142_length_377_cov_1.446043_1_plen_79_part_01